MRLSLTDFISRCPTSFHTVGTVAELLASEGFVRFMPQDAASFSGRYYFTLNHSTIVAFTVPDALPRSLSVAAAHGDSPSFRLKFNRMLKRGGSLCLNAERYGGMELKSWFDVPLGVAGRLVVREGDCLKTVLCDTKKGVCLIPNAAVHLLSDREPDPAQDLFPLYSANPSAPDVLDALCADCGADPSSVLGSDLFVYNAMPGLVWGAEGEFVSAPRLDDLQCVYAALGGFLSSAPGDSMRVLCVFDNEEVGSATKQGADSGFFDSLMRSVLGSLGAGEAEIARIIASSFAVSADNAHGVHPNRSGLSDALDRPVLNGGPAVKFNASQRYATDAFSCAVVRALAEKARVPLQFYSNRPDLRGGSTLGGILTRHFPIDCADLGAPQLAMHSAFETAGARDTDALRGLFEALFSASFERRGDELKVYF